MLICEKTDESIKINNVNEIVHCSQWNDLWDDGSLRTRGSQLQHQNRQRETAMRWMSWQWALGCKHSQLEPHVALTVEYAYSDLCCSTWTCEQRINNRDCCYDRSLQSATTDVTGDQPKLYSTSTITALSPSSYIQVHTSCKTTSHMTNI